MFGIGILELCVIAVVFIVFVGPTKLPEVMRHLGKFVVQAKRMSNEVKSTIDTAVYEAERELHLENLKKINNLTKGNLNSHLDSMLKEENKSTEENTEPKKETSELKADDLHQMPHNIDFDTSHQMFTEQEPLKTEPLDEKQMIDKNEVVKTKETSDKV